MTQDDDDDTEGQSAYLQSLLRRTKDLREARNLSQAEAAQLIGVKLDAYKKYEQRSPLPHHLIPRFCRLVGTSEGFFLTGKNRRDEA